MRRAFTLVELLGATALTALLMLAVLNVIGAAGRARAAMARRPVPPAWAADVLDGLRRDLANSTAVRFAADGVVLAGHAALDRATLAPGDEPVTVTYAVATVAGRRWLVRRQATRGGAGGPEPWQELVCPDVAGFEIRPAAAIDAARPTAADSDDPQPVPPAVVVRIDGPAGLLVDQTLVLR